MVRNASNQYAKPWETLAVVRTDGLPVYATLTSILLSLLCSEKAPSACLKLPHDLDCLLDHLGRSRRPPMQHPGRHLLHRLPRRCSDIDMFAIDVVPSAAAEEEDMVWEVESGCDGAKAREEEEDGVCRGEVSDLFERKRVE